jgi:hypothetical protein
MDFIDPHRHDLADAAPEWSALARYAEITLTGYVGCSPSSHNSR